MCHCLIRSSRSRGPFVAIVAVGCAVSVLASGCGKPVAPVPPVPKALPAKAQAKVEAYEAPKVAIPESPSTKNEEQKPPVESVAAASPIVNAANVETSEPAKTFERFVLFTPASPLLIELELTIDGKPHSEALERLVDEVLQVADTDGDGRATWKEVTVSKRFMYGQYGNLPIDKDNAPKQIIELYDIDRDGLVDRTELPRFLTRNAGGSRAFSLRGTANYRDPGRDSPTWQLLDGDGDGALSAEEMAAAPGRLHSRDTDDDESLTAGDLNPRLVAMPGQMPERRRRRDDAAKLLGPHANWDSVRAALEEIYALGGRLTPDCFPMTPKLFAELDADKNGTLSRTEFQRLNDAPPHIRLAVNFGKSPEQKTAEQEPAEAERTEEKPPLPHTSQLKLLGTSDELAEAGVSVVEHSGRYTLRVSGMTIGFYVNDTAGNEDYEARAQQALTTFDADKNGYLEEKEVPEQAQAQIGRIEAVDTDTDGKIYPGEIVTYLRQQQAALRSQVHAKAGDREDALFAALDANGDDRLDAREISGAAAQLQKFDRSGDGSISDDEIPVALMVGLARGSLQNIDALFAPPAIAAKAPDEKTPRWFLSMDASGDGVISRREFLGTAEQFTTLDRNQDEFLDSSEAVAAINDSSSDKSASKDEPTP